MASMRGAAEKSYDDKLDRMGVRVSTASTGAKGIGDVYPQDDGTQGNAQGSRAAGYATERENEQTLAAKEPKKLRLDRKGFAHGGAVKKKGGTTVNVIVAPQQKEAAPSPMMPPPGMGAPPPMPLGKPPGPSMAPPGGGMPPPELMGRAKGGRVPMKAGAGGGLGRLDKIDEYGDRAKPEKAARAGTM